MPKSKKTVSKPEESNKQDQKAQELESQLKRALADYHNLERRVEEERRLLSSLSSALLIEKFLPVLDNLENANTHLNDQGLEIVIKQFKNLLQSEGVEEIDSKGQQFDPNLHEAIETQEGENNNMIVRITRKGYKMNDKVLRPAQVIVERKTIQNEQKGEDQVADTAN